jgi:glycosyltransferase involved in cell wall biosynthesis
MIKKPPLKFSAIVPAYNEEKIIGNCLTSLKNQTRPFDEIIVVNNGCIDRTAKIAVAFGAKVVCEKKKGISYARNKGAKETTGDIICFIDSDGVVDEDWLRLAERGFKKRGVKAVVGFNVFSHKKIAKALWYNTYTATAYSSLILLNLLTERLFLAGNNFAIRKDVFWKLGGFDPVVGEDYFLSEKFWKLPSHKGIFNSKMVIKYSSRGFDAAGYLRTISCWMKSANSKIPQEKYDFKSKTFL